MNVKRRIVIKDSIQGITVPLIRRFADYVKLTDNYRLSRLIYDHMRNWSRSLLENFLTPLYNNSNLKLYLDPKDLNMKLAYKHGSSDDYQWFMRYAPFERIIREILQDIVHPDADYKLSKEGVLLMLDYYVEHALDLFTKIKTYMDTTEDKCVEVRHILDVTRNQ